MRDRMPAPGKENRVRITQDNGQSIEGVLSYADDAAQPGSCYNRANVMPDGICDAFALDRISSEPKDLFAVLSAIPDGKGMLVVSCKESDGSPCAGAVWTVTRRLSVTPIDINMIGVTNINGISCFLLPPGKYQLTAFPPIDFCSIGGRFITTVQVGRVTRLNRVFYAQSGTSNTRIFDSAVTGAFSKHVARADIFAVGGGGGGGCVLQIRGEGYSVAAAGGAGGFTQTASNIPLVPYKITIGAGGTAPALTTWADGRANGTGGGSTIVESLDGAKLLTASGGEGGQVTISGSLNQLYIRGASGGSGSGALSEGQVGTNGFDGASGGGFTTSSGMSVPGGSGQGRTTRAFAEPGGELYASAGQSNCNGAAQAVGAGGGLSAYRYLDNSVDAVQLYGGAGTTHGSGGGPALIRCLNTPMHYVSATSVDLRGGDGRGGMVMFRWEVNS